MPEKQFTNQKYKNTKLQITIEPLFCLWEHCMAVGRQFMVSGNRHNPTISARNRPTLKYQCKPQNTKSHCRGGICPSRQCLFLLKLLKLGEIDGVKFLAWIRRYKILDKIHVCGHQYPTFAINTLTLLLRLELPAPPQCSPDVTKGPGQLDILHLMVIFWKLFLWS